MTALETHTSASMERGARLAPGHTRSPILEWASAEANVRPKVGCVRQCRGLSQAEQDEVGARMKELSGSSRILRGVFVAGLMVVVQGGCGMEVGGGVPIGFPPDVWMERWESIGPDACRGLLTNHGGHTARDVRVPFWYKTARGDTELIVAPTSTNIEPYASAAVFVPPQI